MTQSLEQWIDREYRYAAMAMLRSVSATEIVKTRPGFGQTIRPAKGSIIASPVLASYDPDPDYFFHWFRDSAVVIDALRLLYEDGSLGEEALAHFADFVRFGLSLQTLDGRDLVTSSSWREPVVEKFVQYLRDDADLAGVQNDSVVAETRVNPDGSLDISKWARPQHDGPPLRALAMLRWTRHLSLGADADAPISELIRSDLAFTFNHGDEPSFDIWEEEKGLHYYTLRVSAAALSAGAQWMDSRGNPTEAELYRAKAAAILSLLDGFWMEEAAYYRSRVLESGERSTKELDIAVILSAIHAEASAGVHSVQDVRMQSTLTQLDRLFDGLYAINRDRPADRGVAMGRYEGDVYYSGGAYFFSTLGAAEFCFLAATVADDPAAWIARGDAYLGTVRAYTAVDGDLSEQFDQNSGEQTSARHLAWSYAAFISCVGLRRKAIGHRSR